MWLRVWTWLSLNVINTVVKSMSNINYLDKMFCTYLGFVHKYKYCPHEYQKVIKMTTWQAENNVMCVLWRQYFMALCDYRYVFGMWCRNLFNYKHYFEYFVLFISMMFDRRLIWASLAGHYMATQQSHGVCMCLFCKQLCKTVCI